LASSKAKEFSHPAVIIFATPDGRVSRYLHGVKFDPQAVRLSTITASDGNLTPSLRDVFVYYCFTFDHTTGKYTATARTIMMIGGAVTMVTLGAVIALLLLAERRGRARREGQPPEAGPPPGGAFA
ncbi:MAG: SCO family protein, partial [Planctomycetota bacterium]